MNTRPSPSMKTLPAAPPPFAVRLGQRLQRWLRRLALHLAPPQFALMDLVGARWVSDALGALVRLGVPEALADGPRAVDDIADELEVDRDGLFRLLRALASEKLLTRDGDRFGLTRLTEPLRRDHAESMRWYTLNQTADHNARTWSDLHSAVRTGRRNWDDLHGTDMWTWLAEHPDQAEVFHGTMAEFTRDAAPTIARSYPFDRHTSLVDLGGGTGTLLSALLSAWPNLRGVLVDQEDVLQQAPAVLASWGVADRTSIQAGDALSWAPAGHDAYLAKHLLHGYGDELAVETLRAWRRAMADDARLLLVELVVPEGPAPFLASLDLQMLVTSFGGRERARAEWSQLLAGGGFELRAVHDTASPFRILEATTAQGTPGHATGLEAAGARGRVALGEEHVIHE